MEHPVSRYCRIAFSFCARSPLPEVEADRAYVIKSKGLDLIESEAKKAETRGQAELSQGLYREHRELIEGVYPSEVGMALFAKAMGFAFAVRAADHEIMIYGEGQLKGILEFTYQDVGEDPHDPGKRKIVGHHDVASIFQLDKAGAAPAAPA